MESGAADPSKTAGSRKTPAEAFTRAYLVSKLARFFHFLQGMYEAFSVYSEHGVSIEEWRFQLHAAEEELNAHDVARNILTEEFNGIWTAARQTITDLRAGMTAYKNAKGREGKNTAVDSIKSCIKQLDLPSLVQGV